MEHAANAGPLEHEIGLRVLVGKRIGDQPVMFQELLNLHCSERSTQQENDKEDDNHQAQHDQQGDLVAIGRLFDLGPMGVCGRRQRRR